MIVWLPFLVLCICRCAKGKARGPVAYLLLWLITVVALFLVQRFSWWQYHTLLFFVPVGLLAVFGVDAALQWLSPGAQSDRTMGASWLLAIPLIGVLFAPFITRAELMAHHAWISGHGVRGYQWAMSEQYARLWNGTQFLHETDAIPGPIYVFGNAKVYQFADREVPHPIVGSSWEFYLPEQIDDITAALVRKRVPYILVGREDRKLFWDSPVLNAFLEQHYRLFKRSDEGVWFVNKSYAADEKN